MMVGEKIFKIGCLESGKLYKARHNFVYKNVNSKAYGNEAYENIKDPENKILMFLFVDDRFRFIFLSWESTIISISFGCTDMAGAGHIVSRNNFIKQVE